MRRRQNHGVNVGIVEKSGSWFSHDSQRIGQGRENAKRFLRDNPEVADVIERKIRENAGLLSDAMLDGTAGSDTTDESEDEVSEVGGE